MQLGDFYLHAQFGEDDSRLRQLPHHHQADRREGKGQLPPGDRHHLAPGLRFRLGLHADRRRSLPGGRRRRAPSTCASTCASTTRTRTSSTGITASTCKAGARPRSSPRSSATTTMPSRPTSRSTRWPARSRPTASPATRASCSDAEMTVDLFDRFFLDRESGRLLLAPRPDHPGPAQRVAGREPGQEELELGRRSRPGLPDQPLSGDRRGHATAGCWSTPSTPSPSTSRITSDSPFVQEKFLEDWSPDQHPHVAAEPRRGRPQSQDRLEPDAHVQPEAEAGIRGLGAQDRRGHARDRRRPAARRLVRRDGARAARRARRSTASPSTTARRGGSRSRGSWPT